MIEIHTTKFLIFHKYKQENKKTYDISVYNREEEKVGKIVFRPSWRTYVFEPMDDMIFDEKCLSEILKYIHYLIIERELNK